MQGDSHASDTDDLFDGPSKSQLKRDATRLQDLGIRLAGLRPKQLDTLDLDDPLLKAIEDHKVLPNSYSARKRHAQYIGKLMRGRDYPALLAAVEERENPRSTTRPGVAPKALSPTAQACQDLLADADACEGVITRLLVSHPRLERQTLRQLTRACFSALKKPDETGVKKSRYKLSHYVSQNLN